MQSADGDNFRLWQCLVPQLDLLGQGFLVTQVYFVDEDEDGDGHALHFLEKVAVLVGRLNHIGNVE